VEWVSDVLAYAVVNLKLSRQKTNPFAYLFVIIVQSKNNHRLFKVFLEDVTF